MAQRKEGTPQPNRVFELDHCTVSFYDGWAWTEFRTGEGWGATPGHDRHYYRLADRLGYGTDIVRYCLEHDLFHSLVEQELFHRPSPIIWCLAHGVKAAPWTTVYEEATVQMFQGYLRAGWEMTATAPGVDWWEIRNYALDLLGEKRQGPDGAAEAPGDQQAGG